jgi:hypothetical protein
LTFVHWEIGPREQRWDFRRFLTQAVGEREKGRFTILHPAASEHPPAATRMQRLVTTLRKRHLEHVEDHTHGWNFPLRAAQLVAIDNAIAAPSSAPISRIIVIWSQLSQPAVIFPFANRAIEMPVMRTVLPLAGRPS